MMRIGIDLGGTKIQGVVLAQDGCVLESTRKSTPAGSYQQTLRALVAMVGALERAAGAGDGSKLTVGIGTPGRWQPARGVMKNCNSTWLNGKPLLTDLVALLGPRVRIANDADCFALSEASDGAGAGCSSVFGIILGTGVGGGLVMDGRLVSGPNGLTGEWGHTPLPYAGFDRGGVGASTGSQAGPRLAHLNELESRLPVRDCYCGRPGCVEAYLSGPGLRRTHRELWGEDRSAEAIASGTDEPARLTSALYTRMLARSIAQVVNILDPAVIVLGGGLSNVEGIYAPVNRMLAQYVFSGECVTVVSPPRWGAESGVLGAARLWPKDGR